MDSSRLKSKKIECYDGEIMLNLKQEAARAAIEAIEEDIVLGVGTGSTVNYFIEALAPIKHRIEACVASSKQTEEKLRAHGIPVIDLNVASSVNLYVDGADEINARGEMIKGGGGALTREKILASCSRQFLCIADETKWVKRLGVFPIAVEVMPMARSYVAREIVKLGGDPQYRQGFVTDNGNIILDVYHVDIQTPIALETELKNIVGVVESGLFAKRIANELILATRDGIKRYTF